jgi:hypothetical protein
MGKTHFNMGIIHDAMVSIHNQFLTLFRHLDLKELNDKTHLRKLKLKTTIWKNTTKNSHCLFW